MRYGIVKVSTADLRAAPSHKSEMVSQGLLGATVRVHGRSSGSDWLKVELPDGYPGWMYWKNVEILPRAEVIDWESSANATLTAAQADVLGGRKSGSGRLRDLVLGCRVICSGRHGGWARVTLPDGVRGWVPFRALRLGEAPPGGPRSIVAAARLFLGGPYLWGGVSPKGSDCSGLVQTAFAVNGIPLPRDVVDQCRCGAEVAADEIKAGDLLFFGASRRRLTHVGIASGRSSFIHAGCPIEEASLDPDDPRYQARTAPRFRLARRLSPNV